MYKVVKIFRDLQDNGHVYSPGDVFPREGVTVTEGRIAALSTAKNRRHTPLIEEVPEPKADIIEPEPKPEPNIIEPEAETETGKEKEVVADEVKPKRGARKKN